MLIRAPTEVSNPLYDGPLDVPDDAQRRRAASAADLAAVNVSIGQPVCWSLIDQYHRETKQIPGALGSLLGDDDAVIVQFACSFRLPPTVAVASARFIVTLQADSIVVPIAFDLFPLRITQDVRRNVRVALAPSLKFREMAEVGLGEIAFAREFVELVPEIEAFGLQEPTFGWDLQEGDRQPVAATGAYYAAVRFGRPTTRIKGTCDLQVDLSANKRVLPPAHLPRNANRGFSLVRDPTWQQERHTSP